MSYDLLCKAMIADAMFDLRVGHIITFAAGEIITFGETKFITVNRRKNKEKQMSDSILRTKSKEFAKRIVFLCRHLKENRVESALVNQLLRAGTSVGANIYEAQYAQGTKDFISKLEIALKECNESEYWLGLLFDTDCISEDEYESFRKECIDLRRMMVSSVKTLKNK
ncbi:MAG: four helix bundle protein [Clostridiales bacterium]|nr:four helix bundle protein [Clostridiales bacterium]